MPTPLIRPPLIDTSGSANQNQVNATTLQRQSADATKKGLNLTATNRPGDALRADVLANDTNQNSGVAGLENFKPRNGSRTKPLVMRFPQEIGLPKGNIPHVMQFKIYWRWEDKNLKAAGEKLKGESEATLAAMRKDLGAANLKEGGFAASDTLINTAAAETRNDMFLTRKASGAASFGALIGAGTAAGAAGAAMSANNNAAERANSKKTMESNIGNQSETVSKISKNMGSPTDKFGATELSQDSTVLGGRLNSTLAKGAAGDIAGKLPGALQQNDPKYDQMVSVYLPVCSRINGDDAFSYDDADMAKSVGSIAALNGILGGALIETAKQAIVGAFSAQGGAVGNVTTALSGMVINPRIEKLFKQKDIRNFAFSWDFYPRNQDEVNMLKDIIETFRYHASPSRNTGTDNGADPQIMLRVPAEFTVKFISSTPNGFSENEHIPKISRCVITGIGVDYSPTGVFTTLPDNSPVAYTLTLSFSEIAQLTREDIGAGY